MAVKLPSSRSGEEAWHQDPGLPSRLEVLLVVSTTQLSPYFVPRGGYGRLPPTCSNPQLSLMAAGSGPGTLGTVASWQLNP